MHRLTWFFFFSLSLTLFNSINYSITTINRMACGRHFSFWFNTFIDHELPNQISHSSIKMKSFRIIIMHYIIVKQVIWNNETLSQYICDLFSLLTGVVEHNKRQQQPKKKTWFRFFFRFYFKRTNPLQPLYSIKHSTDFRFWVCVCVYVLFVGAL